MFCDIHKSKKQRQVCQPMPCFDGIKCLWLAADPLIVFSSQINFVQTQFS